MRLPPALREGDAETILFRTATVLALVHAFDDAFLGRQPGIGLGQHALAALLALVAGLAAVVFFPRLRPGLRAAIALAFGVLAVANGALHVAHVAGEGPARSDYTGILAVLAGAVLIGLALVVPFRHRGERGGTRRRLWAVRLVGALLLVAGVYVFLYPATVALVVTHKHREPIGPPPNEAYEPVTFQSSDGLVLSGWLVDSRNGAAVLLVHGGGGDRMGAVEHAELLASHGYGVLLYDSRGRGESEGSPNALGWGWEKDVEGALAFLAGQEGVEPGRVGGLGLSTGADVLIEVAAEGGELGAVVADGATGRSFADYRNLSGIDAGAPFFFTLYAAARVYSGSSPGEPLEELVAQVAPTPLLLIAGGRGIAQEGPINRLYAEAAQEPVELWDLPDVGHTAAVRERADEYEERVVGLFDDALLGR